MDPNTDTATAAHQLLKLLPEHKRSAAAQLLDLPTDYVVCGIVGDCSEGDECFDDECDHEREQVGELTAGKLLQELIHDIARVELVWDILRGRGIVRPGLTETP